MHWTRQGIEIKLENDNFSYNVTDGIQLIQLNNIPNFKRRKQSNFVRAFIIALREPIPVVARQADHIALFQLDL